MATGFLTALRVGRFAKSSGKKRGALALEFFEGAGRVLDTFDRCIASSDIRGEMCVSILVTCLGRLACKKG